MSTRPPNSPGANDASAANPFGGLGAGLGASFGLFQDWMKAAGSAMPNLQGDAGKTGSAMPAWSMPTLDPAELEKRIQDLKTVQFWLEQNSRMVAMSIQGLEVQRMTLTTLKGMNVSLDNLRESLKARAAAPDPAAAAPTSAGTPGSDAEPNSAAAEAGQAPPDLINPLRWWETLTQQFTHLAAQAAQNVSEAGDAKPSESAQSADSPAKKATSKVAAKKAPASKTTRRKPAAS
ncbi:MAG: hypothetical protein Q7U28_12220 [Aquabacterium sp.]|nr:hypothetical protein [Aquabacterium sp.]